MCWVLFNDRVIDSKVLIDNNFLESFSKSKCLRICPFNVLLSAKQLMSNTTNCSAKTSKALSVYTLFFCNSDAIKVSASLLQPSLAASVRTAEGFMLYFCASWANVGLVDSLGASTYSAFIFTQSCFFDAMEKCYWNVLPQTVQINLWILLTLPFFIALPPHLGHGSWFVSDFFFIPAFSRLIAAACLRFSFRSTLWRSS